MLRSYDRAMWLRRTRKGWAEPAPKRCANGHELRGGTVLVARVLIEEWPAIAAAAVRR